MGRHEDFQISVDGDNRVSVNFQANPGWHRSQCCWEAKGPVAEKFNSLEPRIRAELNQSRRESGPEAAISLFMVGKTPEDAKPIIVISCTDKETRRDAKKAIKDSGVIRDTYFDIGYMRYSPPGPLQPVTMDDKTSRTFVSSAQPHEVFFDPTERIRLVGMSIIVKQAGGLLRWATANAVYDGRHFGYITAAHAFEPPTLDAQDADDEDDMDMPFDIDDGSLVAEDLDLLSIHSATSPETSDSGQSFLSVTPASLSRGSTTQMAADPLHSSLSTSEELDSDSGLLDLSVVKTLEANLHEKYRVLGHLSATVAALDCALVLVADDKVIRTLDKFKEPSKANVYTPDSTKANTKSVIAWTTHGPVKGTLLQTSVPMRLAGSTTYELVYKFTYAECGEIRRGDCGTLVTDPDGAILYGHIIAKSEYVRFKVAYMIAAHSIMEELSRDRKWSLLRIENNARAGQYITSVPNQSINAQHNLIKTSAAYRYIDSGLRSSSRSPRAKSTLGMSLAQRTNERQRRANEDWPSGSAWSSIIRPRKTGTHAQSTVGSSVGSVSLMFQAFAWCIQGYEIISDIARFRMDFLNMAKLKSEEHRVIEWANQVRLDYTDEGLAINKSTKTMVIDLIDQQRILLYNFLETEKDDKLGIATGSLKPPWPLVRTELNSSSIRLSDITNMNEAATISPTDTEGIVQKALGFLKRFQEDTHRLRRSAYHSDECGELLEKLTALNEQMQRMALMHGSTTALSSGPTKDLDILKPTDRIKARGTKLDIRDICDLDDRPIDISSRIDTREEGYYKGIQVWVEWRKNGIWHFVQPRVSQDSVAELSAWFEMKDDSASYHLCIPHGLGYFEDEDMGRFGLVFKTPDWSSGRLTTLNDLFRNTDSNGYVIKPSLSERIVAMRTISEALEQLHRVNWLHKDLRSPNILFLKDKISGKQVFTKPIVSGFQFSQPAAEEDPTERLPNNLAANMYRHPLIQKHAGRSKFRKSHDVYSLGLLLLEIAHWKCLDQILPIDLNKSREVHAVRKRLLTEGKWLHDVKSDVGDTIEQIIRSCLEGPEAFGVSADLERDEAEAKLQRAFSEQVVGRLAAIRGL